MTILEEKKYQEAKYVAYSTGDSVVIEMSVPGYEKSNIAVNAKENGLTISAEPVKEVAKGVLVVGFTNFYPIPDWKKFNKAAINAAYVNGILKVTLPVKDEYKAVKITVA